MKFLNQKKGFLGFESNTKVKNKVIVVPFGLEKTVSYGSGTKNGPKEIIKASHQVELFDEDLNKEPYKKLGIRTIKPFAIKRKLKDALKQIGDINEKIISQNKFPLVFGGEHTITPGCIRPFVKKYKELYILHFDAHADLREKYNGEKFSHACAIKRCLDFKNVKIVSIGIRNLSNAEMVFYKQNQKRIKIFWAKDIKNWNINIISKILRKRMFILRLT